MQEEIEEEQQKEKQILEYMCPKCHTKVIAENGKRLPSLYCRNCIKAGQVTMLRMIQPHNLK